MARKRKKRILKNRRRIFSKGKIIRVSDEVHSVLCAQTTGRSWDIRMRRLLGMPTREGDPQPLVEGVLEVSTGKFFLRKQQPWEKVVQDAYEVALLTAARNKKSFADKPRRMRELP